MKVLITGGTGFVGHYLTDRLQETGHEVYLLGLFDNAAALLKDKVSFYEADLTSKSSLEACRQKLPKIDVLIHLAALVPKTTEEDKPLPMVEVNVKGTLNLLEIFGSSVKRLVYASTAEVYGLPEGTNVINEKYLPSPISYYGASKYAAELFCNVYSQKQDLSLAILRFTVLYGPGDTINRAIPNFINKALNGEPLEIYGGEELRDYLHIIDAAEALYLAASSSATGLFNIGTGQGISIKRTAEAITKKIKPDLPLNIRPRQKKAANIVMDITKAQRELKFQPKHFFPDLIDEQIEWHKKH